MHMIYWELPYQYSIPLRVLSEPGHRSLADPSGYIPCTLETESESADEGKYSNIATYCIYCSLLSYLSRGNFEHREKGVFAMMLHVVAIR